MVFMVYYLQLIFNWKGCDVMKDNVINVDFSSKVRQKKIPAKFQFTEQIKKLFALFKKKSNLKLTSSKNKNIL